MTCLYCTPTRQCGKHRHAVRPHTAQELYRFARTSPGVQANLRRTAKTLRRIAKYQVFDTQRAIALIVKNNVRDAAIYYVQHHGLNIAWHKVFPPHEREGCAALMLRSMEGELGI